MKSTSELIFVLTLAISGMIWVVTSKSPFVWLAHLGVHLEAARVQLISSTWLAMRHFAKQYPRQVERVRQEVMS